MQLDEAVALSQHVVSMAEEAGEFLPRAYLCLGLCYSLKASEGKDAQTNKYIDNIFSHTMAVNVRILLPYLCSPF